MVVIISHTGADLLQTLVRMRRVRQEIMHMDTEIASGHTGTRYEVCSGTARDTLRVDIKWADLPASDHCIDNPIRVAKKRLAAPDEKIKTPDRVCTIGTIMVARIWLRTPYTWSM